MKKAFVVIIVTIFIDMLGFGIVIPILPTFSKELGAADYQVGLIAMSFPVMNFLFAPFWGSLSDKKGRRPIILFSVFLTMLAYLLFAVTTNLWILLASRILAGIGSANLSVAQSYIADITTPQERTKSMGLIGAAFGLGFVIGPTIGGFMKTLSTPGTVDMVGYVAAALCLINAGMAFLMLPESLTNLKKEPMTFRFQVFSQIITELRKPIIREILVINFVFITAFMIMQIAVTLFWKEYVGLDEKEIGGMFAFIGVMTLIVQGFLIGILSKKYGEMKLVVVGSYLVMISLIMMPWVTRETFAIEFVAFAIMALANGCITPSVTSLLSRKSKPDEIGRVLGVNQSFGSIARACGMGLSGLMYGIEFHLPFVVGSLVMIAAILLATRLSNTLQPGH